MKKWVWYKGLTAMGAFCALFAACSDVKDTAGSSFETENSIAMTIMVADGSAPAARTKVLVRPDGYLAGASSRKVGEDPVADSIAGIFNRETDDQGQLNLPKMKAGEYVVEARGDSVKAFSRMTVRDSVDDLTLTMDFKKAGSMKGQVVMPAGVRSVSVGIRGLDYVVQTDSLGNFEFPSLPEGSFNAVGFMFSTYNYVNEVGEQSTYDSFQALGVEKVMVESQKTREDVVIGSRQQLPVEKDSVEKDPVAKDSVISDTTIADTTVVDSIPEDTVVVYPYVLLDDFENGIFAWYTSASRHASAKLETASISGKRTDNAARLECSKDSVYYEWTMMGHRFADYTDFSDLDSVVIWARAEFIETDSMWISVSFDVQADSASGYESGKAWAHVGLVDDEGVPTEEWLRIVVTPEDLVPTDSTKNGGNIGWDAVKDHVNSFGIFAGGAGVGAYAVWIDDVEIYGVKGLIP